jgi:hypothetical protein
MLSFGRRWRTVTEVKTNLAFGLWKRGQRLDVDIHDPAVAGLVQAGYLSIIWKELPDARDPLDFAGPGSVPAGGVDAGMARPAQGAVNDVADTADQVAGDPVSTPRGRSSRKTDQ